MTAVVGVRRAGRGRRVRPGRLGGRAGWPRSASRPLVAPAPGEVWPATYGCWVDELGPVGVRSIARTWPSVRVVGRREHEVPRAYAVLDNARLHEVLSDAFGRAGGRTVAGAAAGVQHFGWGSRLLRAGDRPLDVRLIVDATGGGQKGLLRRAGPPRPPDGVRLLARFDRPPHPAGPCTLMDWSPADPDGTGRDPGRPFSTRSTWRGPRPGRGDGPRRAASMADGELRRRLMVRLERLGVTPTAVLGEEHVDIPMGGRSQGAGRRRTGAGRPGAPGDRLLGGGGLRAAPAGGRRAAVLDAATSRTGSRPRRGRRCGRPPGGAPAARAGRAVAAPGDGSGGGAGLLRRLLRSRSSAGRRTCRGPARRSSWRGP